MSPIDETLKEFLVESHENLDALERDLVTIEAHARDPQTLARIFRTIHTIKGTCGFLALPRLEAVAHAGESLLCDLRDNRLSWTPDITGALLALVDKLRSILRAIEATGDEDQGDDAPLIARLHALQSPEVPSMPVEVGSRPDLDSDTDSDSDSDSDPENGTESPSLSMAQAPTADSAPTTAPTAEIVNGNVRVDVGLLDKLMNLVGELVLTRNQILQHAAGRDDSALLGSSQRLNLITTELQEGVMKTRMQPIGTVWNKFPRVVRDLALSCRKQVQIEMEGRETELDRTIIEAIKDPLTHLVRNAIDHGIESPQDREAAGKPAMGRLRLRAYHESGQVIIEISDDGAGINPERIGSLAHERGLLTRDQLARMDERDLLHLIFLPGFSTAERVTNISGRGVGMDVVKTNIEKIGGTVDLQSAAGEGTTLKIKIPLTLAIIPALIVASGGDRYAIPQVNLLELVRLEGEQARREIETIKGTPIYRLRGHLLPLVHLSGALGRSTRSGADGQSRTIDFSLLRDMHQRWITRLENMVSGAESIDPKSLSSSHECDLGRWIDGQGGQLFGGEPGFERLRDTHQRFHDAVNSMVRSFTDGERSRLDDSLRHIRAISFGLMSNLQEMERLVEDVEAVSIVVLQADGRQFGLVVEDISDTEEIVVKPLGKHLKGLSLFAGATIMGDGRVALILDVPGIAQRAGLATVGASISEAEARATHEATRHAERHADRQSFLLFRMGTDRRMAVPMDLVARLEEVPSSSVERAAGREVVQYRDEIMPLLRLGEVLGIAGRWGDAERASTMPVIVYRRRGRGVGLVVDEILDVVEDVPRMQRSDARGGLLGSAVIQDHVTDLLDVDGLIRMADLDTFDTDDHVSLAVGAASSWEAR